MGIKQKPTINTDDFIAGIRREKANLQKVYRDLALKLYPHVCARCGREFMGKRIRELTVHHKDHNHDNNPPDGSNWELLCIYCHDNEHSRYLDSEWSATTTNEEGIKSPSGNKPFAGLANLLKQKNKNANES